MSIAQVKTAVDELGRTWAAFQEQNDRRNGRNQDALTKMNTRMDQLESAIRRAERTVAPSDRGKNYGAESRAYFDYLRHGTRDEPNAHTAALTREEMKALTVGSDPTAGYLAPAEFAREIIKGEVEFSPLRSIARVRQTSRRSLQMPKRRGTEWATAGHAAGEHVILLTEQTLSRVNLPDSDLGTTRFYRGVTLGGLLSESVERSLVLKGRALMPYAPVDLRGTRGGSPLDWSLSWKRRTRLGGAWKDAIDVPLGEVSEAYEVDILNGSSVVRTLTADVSAAGSVVTPASRTAVYTNADQITDFGAEQANLNIRVYQLSATLGRGFPAAALLNA